VLLTPQGRPAKQRDLARWAALPHLVLIAGRYEGFDERVRGLADEEISAGDFVLTGGEYAALAVIDGVIRLLPGTVGNAGSIGADSFSEGLLEHPHYTRPEDLEGARIPEVLASGDHARIAEWRRRMSLARTRARRPDLIAERGFDARDRALLRETASRMPAIEVLAAIARPEATVLGELAKIVGAYELARLHLVSGSAGDAIEAGRSAPHGPELAADPRESRRARERAKRQAADRARRFAEAAARIVPAASAEAVIEDLRARRPDSVLVAAAAEPPEGARYVSPSELRELGPSRAILLILGQATALADRWLPPVRAVSPSSDLPLAPALAVLLDRLVGEG